MNTYCVKVYTSLHRSYYRNIRLKHHFLMTEKDTVSEVLDFRSGLTWLIA